LAQKVIKYGLFWINPYGERINFSLQGEHGIFRNSILTPGAQQFDKALFCQQVLQLFCGNRLTNISLVIAEIPDHMRRKLFSNEDSPVKLTHKSINGFGYDSQGQCRAPFDFQGIRSNATNQEIEQFIFTFSRFSQHMPVAGTVINDNQDRRSYGGDKYFSQHIISTQITRGETMVSMFYGNARLIDVEGVISEFEKISTGKVITVTRRLSLPKEFNTIQVREKLEMVLMYILNLGS
jgi:hypothetical protein